MGSARRGDSSTSTPACASKPSSMAVNSSLDGRIQGAVHALDRALKRLVQSLRCLSAQTVHLEVGELRIAGRTVPWSLPAYVLFCRKHTKVYHHAPRRHPPGFKGGNRKRTGEEHCGGEARSLSIPARVHRSPAVRQTPPALLLGPPPPPPEANAPCARGYEGRLSRRTRAGGSRRSRTRRAGRPPPRCEGRRGRAPPPPPRT